MESRPASKSEFEEERTLAFMGKRGKPGAGTFGRDLRLWMGMTIMKDRQTISCNQLKNEGLNVQNVHCGGR